MSFVSYAQNFEDVLLWRALGHIAHGFYIDVGANDPVENSVTKAFYDAGWNGVNIEPLPALYQDFLRQRPLDVNLAIAAGAREDRITLYDVPEVNGWASLDRAVAESHRAEGYAISELTVPMRTLASVCAEHVTGEIHFLKIDVEGFETEVLRGMDFGKWRPWLLVIEATLPNSRVTNYELWEALVTGQRYRFAYFDGLNRYYVADEHSELLDALAVQPNVFDNFISHHLERAWRANQAARAADAVADERLAQSARLLAQAERSADNATSLVRQALAHSAELLAKYEAANLRAEQAHEAQLAAEAHLSTLGTLLAETDEENCARGERLAAAEADAAGLQAQLDAVHAHSAVLRHNLEQASTHGSEAIRWACELEQRLLATLSSTSWRVTRPLRSAGSLARGVTGKQLKAGAARVVKPLVQRVTASERMRRLLVPLLLRHPAKAAKVANVLSAIRQAGQAPGDAAAAAAAAPAVQVPEELKGLPAAARNVLADLQRAHRNSTDT
jgi:FkbM family methyltransferase